MIGDKAGEWPLLSAELQAHVDEWDFDKRKDETEKQREARNFVEKLVQVCKTSVESVSEQWVERVQGLWREDRAWFESAIDEVYSKETVAEIPHVVSRFLKLDPLLVGALPKSEVSHYLREATRCHFFGLSQAAVALCRAAIEIGLDEVIQDAGRAPKGKLAQKIEAAKNDRLISEEAAILADKVRDTANIVLHEKRITSGDSHDTLVAARGAIIRFYSH